MTHAELTKKLSKIENELLGIRRQISVVYDLGASKRAVVLRETGGALRKRIKGNVVAWQKKIRSAW